MHIDEQTVIFAMLLLNENYEQIWKKKVGKQRDTQLAYYTGMKTMMEIMLSNVYKLEIHIDVDSDGKHSIREKIADLNEVKSVS